MPCYIIVFRMGPAVQFPEDEQFPTLYRTVLCVGLSVAVILEQDRYIDLRSSLNICTTCLSPPAHQLQLMKSHD